MDDEPYKLHNSLVPQGYAPTMHHRRVPADLAGLVHSIVGYRENGAALVDALEMAPLVIPLIISFGDPFEIALGRRPTSNDRYGSFTSGLYPGFVSINSTGRAECIQIDFTPRGAFHFFGMPLSEIAERRVTLDELGDRKIGDLRAALSADESWQHRFERAEAFLRDRFTAVESQTGPVDWAFQTIVAGNGQIRIADVARDIGWSRKHLLQRFRQQIGIGPKAVSRMVRFNHAVGLARQRQADGWAGIAVECGYADQAHMVREFRAFAGSTPSTLPFLAS